MAFFVIYKVLHLAQVPIALLLIFFNYTSNDTNGRGVKRLAFFASLQLRAFFPNLSQGLV